MTDQQKVREAFPRYAAYRHLRAYGAWPSGVPDWAKNHEGSMDDVTLRNAVIDELAQAAIAHASSATVKENLTVGSAESGERSAPEEVVCEVIGHVKEGKDGPYIDWTPEGGIHSLPPGLPIFALEGDFDTEDGWASLYTHPAPSAEDARGVPDIKAMVSRFLAWRLPQDFHPDGGISFTHATDPAWTHDTWPIGTNLFTAAQAEAMLRHVLDVPAAEDARDSAVLRVLIAELRRREQIGRKKYGADLDRKDLSASDLCQHLREELMDALMYSHAFDQALAAERGEGNG